jgi:hypothetical protein
VLVQGRSPTEQYLLSWWCYDVQSLRSMPPESDERELFCEPEDALEKSDHAQRSVVANNMWS